MKQRTETSRDRGKRLTIVKSSSRKKKILVADDDPGIRDILSIIFERAGYEVTLKEDGRDILRNNYTKPDIFLIDKQLSGVDGLDICRYLKSQPATSHIPVIIISASPDLKASSMNAGADAYVEKPFDLKHLLQFVERHLGSGKVVHSS